MRACFFFSSSSFLSLDGENHYKKREYKEEYNRHIVPVGKTVRSSGAASKTEIASKKAAAELDE